MFVSPSPLPDMRTTFALENMCAPDLPGTALQQSGTYAAVLARLGCKASLAQIRSGDLLIGQARIHLRRVGPLRIAWMPRGPVWLPGLTADLRVTATRGLPRDAPFRAIWALSHDTGPPAPGLRIARGADLAELNLRAPESARRAALHGKWRNRLARAETADLILTQRPLDLSCDAPLLRREAAQRHARGYAGLPPKFTEAWADIAPDDSLLSIAYHAGVPVAFMLILTHGDVATYHIGWTGARGRHLSAHNLLLWRASCALARAGVARLDLGKLNPTRTPGLDRFKLGTGAARRSLGPTMLRL